MRRPPVKVLVPAGAAVVAVAILTTVVLTRGGGGSGAPTPTPAGGQAIAPVDGGPSGTDPTGTGSPSTALGETTTTAAGPTTTRFGAGTGTTPTSPGAAATVGAVVRNPDPEHPVPSTTPGPQGPLRSTPCTAASGPTIQLPQRDEPGAGRWVTIGRTSGACGGRSDEFATTNATSRLVFRSDASQLVVELVDAARGRDAAGGQPDLVCGGPCAGTQELSTSAGRFRIEVQGTDAPWEIEVQELRPS